MREILFLKPSFPPGEGGGGRHWGKTMFGSRSKRSIRCVLSFYTFCSHGFPPPLCPRELSEKLLGHELRSQWLPTSTLLLLHFSSQGFPLGSILNPNNGSKDERQTAHYWKECQESWEADLAPQGVLHLIAMASFIVTGGSDQCFFSFSFPFSNCWDKSKPRRIKISQTGQE